VHLYIYLARYKIFVFTFSRALKIRFDRSVNIILFIQSVYVFNFYIISGRPTRRDYFEHADPGLCHIYFAAGHLREGSAAECFIIENRKMM